MDLTTLAVGDQLNMTIINIALVMLEPNMTSTAVINTKESQR